MGRLSPVLMMLLRVGAFAACLQLAVAYPFVAAAQQPAQQPAGAAAQQPAAPAVPGAPAAQAPGRGRGPQPVDSRVQIRTHHFADTNEDIPYALFVSSKVKKGQKAPMIVTLHGLGGTHTTMMRPNAIDLAEAGGYILLAPMGYNPRGWFGAPAPQGRRGAPPANAAPNSAAPNAAAPNAAAPNAAPPNPAAPNQTAAAPQGRRGGGPGGANPNDPPNLRELSEKETLQVIELVRKEFTVDDNRTYVMGHSMGGAGTLYLAIKYPQRWAAAAAIAPAAFSVDKEGLSKIPKMPVMVVHGDMDTVVPTSVGRAWVDAMKSLNMNYQYIEVPGGDHGSVISSHQADIFAFFAKHSR
ncbi:MAG TPA: prolyl oligopeptidase family serine peptidase [Vicinamibacterales bacterium]|nr:prolyl oligopeptidase family serine peptidase [Vicinamibacterales bacterium]